MPGWSSGVQLLATPRGRPSFVSKTNSRRRRRKLSAAKLQRSRENIARHSRSIGRDSSQQCIVENEDPRSFIYLSIANFEKPESSCYTWIVNFKILENSKNRFFLVQANPKMIWLRPKSRDGKVSLAVHWRANFENSLRIMLLNRSKFKIPPPSPPAKSEDRSIVRTVLIFVTCRNSILDTRRTIVRQTAEIGNAGRRYEYHLARIVGHIE